MSLLPEGMTPDYGVHTAEYPSDTWMIAGDRIIGMGTGLEAVKQAVDVILNVERYRYQIYSPDFGSELKSLIGKEPEYAESMLQRRITEALLMDKRILSVDNFTADQDGIGVMLCSVEIQTVFGSVRREVELG